MAHDAVTEIREDVGRRGGLGEYVCCIDFAVEFAKFEMISSASLVHKVNTQVNVLCAHCTAGRTTGLRLTTG